MENKVNHEQAIVTVYQFQIRQGKLNVNPEKRSPC